MNLGDRLLAIALLSVLLIAVAHAQTKRVLMLHSFGPDFGDEYAEDLRAELDRRLPRQLDLYEHWLISARFSPSEDDAAFANYLGNLFSQHPLDLIITIGAPAAKFVQTYRKPLFASTPVLFTDVEERRVAVSQLEARDAAVAMKIDFAEVGRDILHVLPHTASVTVVIGNSPIEKYWIGQIGDSLRPFKDRFTVSWLTGLPWDEVLRRAATLPPRSAILFALVSPEVSGVPKDEDAAFAELHAVADAPIFSYLDVYLGRGLVGGPVISGEEFVRKASNAAERMLRGESGAAINTPAIRFASPQYDWRELRRWKISEADLPRGYRILFREQTFWEQHRWQILAVLALLVLETALIVNLLYERRQRHRAEVETQNRFAELAHMNRRASVGELSASINHELSQPLGAILRNTEAAEAILNSPAPSLDDLRDIVADIGNDDRRASEVIKRVRQLLMKAPIDWLEVDLDETVREVIKLLAAQARAGRVTLTLASAPSGLRVRGDRVQLQQVVMNLVMNGMEAMASARPEERQVSVRVERANDGHAEVSISDAGHGIPSEQISKIFDPFFTTKEGGMGMGLSIARTIIEAHGGRLWAENRADSCGATFRFRLPVLERAAVTAELTESVAK
jgi:signal transduction histidine kinase